MAYEGCSVKPQGDRDKTRVILILFDAMPLTGLGVAMPVCSGSCSTRQRWAGPGWEAGVQFVLFPIMYTPWVFCFQLPVKCP